MLKNSFLIVCLISIFALPAQYQKWVGNYDEVYNLTNPNISVYYALKNGKYGAVNQQGKEILPFIFEDVLQYHNTQDHIFLLDRNKNLLIVEKKQKWGAYNLTGQLVIPFDYDKLEFDEGHEWGIFQRNQKWGYINQAGDIMLSAQFDEANIMSENHALVKKGKKWAIIDKEGRYKSNYIYENERFMSFQDGLCPLQYEGLWGLIDTNAKWRVLPIYENLFRNSKGVFMVEKANKSGFMDSEGKELVPLLYDRLGNWQTGDLPIWATKDGKYGFVDKTGKVVIDIEYENAEPFISTCALVYVQKQWKIIDKQGNQSSPFLYDDIVEGCWGEKMLGVKREGKWTLIDLDGKEALPPTFEDIGCILTNENSVEAVLNGKYGCINYKGKTIIPFIYDKIALDYDKGKIWRAQKDNKVLYFDQNGKKLSGLH